MLLESGEYTLRTQATIWTKLRRRYQSFSLSATDTVYMTILNFVLLFPMLSQSFWVACISFEINGLSNKIKVFLITCRLRWKIYPIKFLSANFPSKTKKILKKALTRKGTCHWSFENRNLKNFQLRFRLPHHQSVS